MNNNNNRPRDPRQNGGYPPQKGQVPQNGQYQNINRNSTNNGAQYNQNRGQAPQHRPGVQNGARPHNAYVQQNGVRPQNGQQYRAKVQQQAYPPVRHRSRKQAQRAALTMALVSVVLVLLLVSVIIFAARCAINIFDGSNDSGNSALTDPAVVTDGDAVTAPPVTEPPVTEPPLDDNYEYITLTEADVHKGYQILINYDNPYNFAGDFNFKTLYSAKNGLYKVSNTTDSIDSVALTWFVNMMAAMDSETGNNDIIITSADRTYEFQEQLYLERVDMYGEEFAQLYVAKPGHSEHHTGLALDLAIYTDGGKAFTFDDKPEYPEWLRANSHKYGYIERYTAEKTAITKIAFENWHYRYIGKPHAYYINTNALCLEEYIETLRLYSFNEPHLTFIDDEGASWELYYVTADKSGTTKVPVPKNVPYEISGNNVDGYIVTVQR